MILDKFLQDAPNTFDCVIRRSNGKVYEASGKINCFFYIKERKSRNQNWGITKNVIDRLKKQNKLWFVLLLSSPPHPNYFLTAGNVEYYIKNRWIPNEDGDYKTAPTFPDENKFKTLGQLKNKIENVRQTALIANSDLHGDKLYLQRARTTLPYLVRQAKAGQTIFYSDLAAEINIPNPRNLNYILGAIGNALIELGKSSKIEIPPIQCLVVNKNTGFPGNGIGWFINKTDFGKLTKSQKQQIVDRILVNIFSFQRWDWILKQLQLSPIKMDIKSEIEKTKRIRGSGGESPSHVAFKNFIASNPTTVGLPATVGVGQTEYFLPSADSIDIVFTDNNTKIGVEVKSKISDTADILRGLFQCVKYKCLIEAEQIVNNIRPDCRIILALEGQLPSELISVKNVLGIEVIDKIKNGA